MTELIGLTLLSLVGPSIPVAPATELLATPPVVVQDTIEESSFRRIYSEVFGTKDDDYASPTCTFLSTSLECLALTYTRPPNADREAGTFDTSRINYINVSHGPNETRVRGNVRGLDYLLNVEGYGKPDTPVSGDVLVGKKVGTGITFLAGLRVAEGDRPTYMFGGTYKRGNVLGTLTYDPVEKVRVNGYYEADRIKFGWGFNSETLWPILNFDASF